MNIAVIGSGYVGLVAGACFAEQGNDVVCVDNDARKIAMLEQGQIPIYEPGLEDLIERNAKLKRLSFTTELESAVQGAEIIFIAVGTPSRRGDGHADLSYVYAVAEEIADLICGQELEDSDDEDADEGEFDKFTKSPIYEDTLRLHRWINNWIESDDRLKDHPEAIRFATRSAVCGAKLAAALCGDEITELGMTIAYLKRALKASNDALDAASKLVEAGLLDKRRAAVARRHVFKIRNRVVDLMAEFRAEWRKRYGDR
jgi:threonine dehydrogenase-like Zn-dependent dehydrogenase